MKIPIRNLYYLFCYAWRKLPEASEIEVGVDSSPDVLHLLARLLATGTQRLVKRGLDRGYVGREIETRAPRGKMLMDAMVKTQSLKRGAAICAFDDLTVDVLHNQILKATIVNLTKTYGLTGDVKERLIALTKQLAQVSDIRLTQGSFRRIQLGRNTLQYGPLLRLCELVHSHLWPAEHGAGFRFADILKDEIVMSKVFEEFLRNFYRIEQDIFSVDSEQMDWLGHADVASDWAFMPSMLTDITLRSPSRAIVIDAKFYQEPLVKSWGAEKIRSSHLYQLTTYVRHISAEAGATLVDGLLIYPSQGHARSLRYQLGGHAIGIELIDFDKPWADIRSALLSVIQARQSVPEV